MKNVVTPSEQVVGESETKRSQSIDWERSFWVRNKLDIDCVKHIQLLASSLLILAETMAPINKLENLRFGSTEDQQNDDTAVASAIRHSFKDILFAFLFVFYNKRHKPCNMQRQRCRNSD